MIHDVVLRWVVIALFGLTAAEYAVAIATERRPWTSIVNHILHLLMGVAMVVMAWPWAAKYPTTPPAAFFLLAAIAFVAMAVLAVRTAAARGLYVYHGLMMLATAWMFVVMDDHLMPAHSSTRSGMPMSMPMNMPGMDMSGMDMPTGSATPAWFTAVGWIGAVGFALAAVFWVYRYFVERRRKVASRRSLGDLGQAMMAAGMVIFFVATLFAI